MGHRSFKSYTKTEQSYWLTSKDSLLHTQIPFNSHLLLTFQLSPYRCLPNMGASKIKFFQESSKAPREGIMNNKFIT